MPTLLDGLWQPCPFEGDPEPPDLNVPIRHCLAATAVVAVVTNGVQVIPSLPKQRAAAYR